MLLSCFKPPIKSYDMCKKSDVNLDFNKSINAGVHSKPINPNSLFPLENSNESNRTNTSTLHDTSYLLALACIPFPRLADVMVLLWPLAGEELKRIQREALDPVVVTQLRKVQHLKPLGRGRWRRPPRSQQAIEEAEARDAVLRRVEPLRWSVKHGEALRMVVEAKVSRKKIALEVDCSSDTSLNFGDAVRVVLPGLGGYNFHLPFSLCPAWGNISGGFS